VVFFVFIVCAFFLLKSLTGGGKCPEEEHTTCSGGPTNCNLSQARFTGRENISNKYKNIY
jgi:hypothetical protein